jgi:hypothetical protein
MIALIPYVRETFRRHLSQKQAVMLVEFDKLKRVGMPHHITPFSSPPFSPKLKLAVNASRSFSVVLTGLSRTSK